MKIKRLLTNKLMKLKFSWKLLYYEYCIENIPFKFKSSIISYYNQLAYIWFYQEVLFLDNITITIILFNINCIYKY